MLTERQNATFEFICEYYWQHGCAPKLAEIAAGIGIQSKGVVHRYLKAIAEEGLIELFPGRSRGIRLIKSATGNFPREFNLPFAGKIAAGKPIEAIPDQNTINLADFFLGPNRFVLKVQGESMIEAGILDGDMVIVEQRDRADDGDIIVALIDNNEATLKRFQKNRDETVTLIPANKDLPPMVYSAERICIQGVVVGQMRSYGPRKPKYSAAR